MLIKRMLEQYYNKETKTLSIPWDFDEELKDLQFDTEVIIFEENRSKYQYSQFNKSVDATRKNFIFTGAPKNNFVFDGDNLPQNLTHLTFGCEFNQKVNNLPATLTHLIC